MTLRRPDAAELAELGAATGIDLTASEIATLEPIVAAVLDGYDQLDQFPDPVRAVTPAVRIPGPRPEPEDDPLNGIVRTCSVKAAP